MTRGRVRPAPGEAYFALVRRFPLRSIESDAELERARTILNELLDRESLDRGEDDYLDILGDLIEKYERLCHPLPPVSELDMLRHFRFNPVLDPHRQTPNEPGPHRSPG